MLLIQVRRNVMDVSYHITQYTNIINDLRVEIQRLRAKLDHSDQHSQSMALHASGIGSRGELSKLKEALTSIFRDQMELRLDCLIVQQNYQ